MTEPNPYSNGDYQWGPAQAGTPGYGYPQGAPGYGYPQQQPAGGLPVPAPGAGMPLVSIGDITVLQDRIVTPAGEFPLKGAMWNATDMSRTEEKTPSHAVVLAIIFFLFCLIGLLFLLMKEKKTVGYIQVSVTSAGRTHTTMIPATSPNTIHEVMQKVNYARSVSA